jgi:hypothetical protein
MLLSLSNKALHGDVRAIAQLVKLAQASPGTPAEEAPTVSQTDDDIISEFLLRCINANRSTLVDGK